MKESSNSVVTLIDLIFLSVTKDKSWEGMLFKLAGDAKLGGRIISLDD